MTLSLVDRNGSATIAAAEGQAALATGDTPRARQKFAEAGAVLEKNIATLRRQSEKHLTRFLAATQYYKGGEYQKALELCQKIEQRLLPAEVRPLCPPFLRDVRSRAAEGYESGVRRKLAELWNRKDYEGILRLLQEHPYVLPPHEMALHRAAVSEILNNYRAAALFFADAVRMNQDDPGLAFTAVDLPLTLTREGRLEEAWEYIRRLVEVLPHPVTLIVASLLCFQRALAATGDDRKRLLDDQERLFDQGRAAYAMLPPSLQATQDMRNLMMAGLRRAAAGALARQSAERARSLCDQVILLEPNDPFPWVLRGIAAYPEAESRDDLRKAVALGDDAYFAYYYLAYDAMNNSDYRSALSWSEQALQKPKKPGAFIQAQLYGWMAICRRESGASREEVEALFRTAREIDPANEEVQNNYRHYLDSVVSAPPHAPAAWDPGRPRGMEELFLSDRRPSVPDKFNGTNRIQRELQTTKK